MSAPDTPAVGSRVRAYDPIGFGAYAVVDLIERDGHRVRVRFDDGSDMWMMNDDIGREVPALPSDPTSAPVPLSIPDDAVQTIVALRGTWYIDDFEPRQDVRAIATPVVAAELRRLAGLVGDHDPRFHAGVSDIASALLARADEIEGQQ